MITRGKYLLPIFLVALLSMCFMISAASADVILGIGDDVNLTCAYNLTTCKVVWVTENCDIAYIRDSGTRQTTITGITSGTTRYYCYYYYYRFGIVDYIDGRPIFGYIKDVLSYSDTVRVYLPPTGITFSATTATMDVNKTGTPVTYSLLPSGADSANKTWSSSNTAVATVNATSGRVSTLQPGTTTITLKVGSALVKSYTLTVTGPKCYITDAILSTRSISLNRNIQFEVYNAATNTLYASTIYTSGAVLWKCTQMGAFYVVAYVKDNETGTVTSMQSATFQVTKLEPEGFATGVTLSAQTTSLRKCITLTGTVGGTVGGWEACLDVIDCATTEVVFSTGYGHTLIADFTAQAMGTYQGLLHVRCLTTNILTTLQSLPFTITEMVPESYITGISLNITKCLYGQPITVTLQVHAGCEYRTSIDVFDRVSGRCIDSTDRTTGKTTYTLLCPEKGLQLYVLGYVECGDTGLVTTQASALFQVVDTYANPLSISSVTYQSGGLFAHGLFNAQYATLPYIWKIGVSGTQGGCLYRYWVYANNDELVKTSDYQASNICYYAVMEHPPVNTSINGTFHVRVKAEVLNENGVTTTLYSSWTDSSNTFSVSRYYYASAIKLDTYQYSIEVGDTLQFNPTVLPSNTSFPTVYYMKKGGDFRAASISDQGLLVAQQPGKVDIYITTLDFTRSACTYVQVEVTPINVDLPLLPASLKTIEAEAFMRSNFTQLRIQNETTTIHDRAFQDCKSLSRIIVPPSVVSIGSDVFTGCSNIMVICVAGSISATYCEVNDIPYKTVNADELR